MNPPYHNDAAYQAATARKLLGPPDMLIEPTEAMRRRAKKLARRWDMDVKDVLTGVVCETSFKAFLRKVGIPPATLSQITLVNIEGTLCLNERPLNDVDPVKMMEVRARIGNVMGWAP